MTSSVAHLPLGDGSVGTGRFGAVSNGRGARSDPFGGSVEGSSFDQRLAAAERAVEGALRRAEARAAAGEAGAESAASEAAASEAASPESADRSDGASGSTRDGERPESDEREAGAGADGSGGERPQTPTRADGQGRREAGADERAAEGAAERGEDEELPTEVPVAPVGPPVVPPLEVRGGASALVEGARLAAALGAFGAAAARGAGPTAGATGSTGTTGGAAAAAPAIEVDADAATPAPFAVEEEALASEVAVVDAANAAADAPAFEDSLPTVEAPAERRADATTLPNTAVERPPIEGPSEASATRPLDPAQLAASNERAARVLEQVRMFVHPGLRRATLELSPANLGRIDVQITFERGEVAAHLVVEAVDTYEALQRHMPELRASLERGGLDVGQLELSFGARDGSQTREQRGESTRGGAGGPANERASATDPRGIETVWLRPNTVAHDRVDTLA